MIEHRPRFDLRHADDGCIWIDGRIGPRDTSAVALRRSLAAWGSDPVRVVVASVGGDIDEAFAMYTALRTCGRRVDMHVRGGISAAGIIAMAGDVITIAPEGKFLLHCAATRVDDRLMAFRLTASFHQALARSAGRSDAVARDIFARRTGQSDDAIRSAMETDTTYNASQAVAFGLADRIADDVSMSTISLARKAAMSLDDEAAMVDERIRRLLADGVHQVASMAPFQCACIVAGFGASQELTERIHAAMQTSSRVLARTVVESIGINSSFIPSDDASAEPLDWSEVLKTIEPLVCAPHSHEVH